MTAHEPTPHIGEGATAAVHERFLALVYDDDEWLRAEFEDIIAVSWDGPHPSAAQPPTGTVWAGRVSADRAGAVTALQVRSRRPGMDGWARQRGPPAGQRQSRPQRR